jgi:ABC-2 type transport system ATP-binding protein
MNSTFEGEIVDNAITVTDLVVERGKATVLNSLSCHIPAGRITGLLGPSGAGKTTLIRAVVGVQVVRSGTVTVLGLPAGARELRAKVGYVTQAPSVYPDLTVLENARYFAAIAGADAAAAAAAVNQVGLSAAKDQLVGTLSGGQRSRASLACAIVGDPQVLVLDEPTVGQDPVLREELWDSFRQRANNGTTVLVSSHVMDEANRCDRLLLIRDGGLLADDTPGEVKRRAGTADLDQAFLELIRHGASS